jgi:hypothetical protein
LINEIYIYSFLVFYAATAITFFVGLEFARIKEQLEFNYLEIAAALGWPVVLFMHICDWFKSKWK